MRTFVGKVSQTLLLITTPYLLGLLVSSKVVPVDWLERHVIGVDSIHGHSDARELAVDSEKLAPSADRDTVDEEAKRRFNVMFDRAIGKDTMGDDPFVDFTFDIHLNGDANTCAKSDSPVGVSSGKILFVQSY